MSAAREPVPGVSVEVEDLVRIRAQLSAIGLQTIRRRGSYRPGARETRIRGRGMEYEESRAYVAGDDVRTLDWRVMARTGDPHTKIFAEEKERRYLLAIDLSSSMFFGTRYAYKSRAAALTAAHLGWLASRRGDRIGGLIAAPRAHYEVRPGKTRAGLLGLFHHLAEISHLAQPAYADGRLNFLLREVLRVAKPGSIIALISDFIGIDDATAEPLSMLVRQHDVSAFWIYDEVETEPWPPGCYPLRLGHAEFDLDMARANTRRWLARQQQQHRDRIAALTTRLDIALSAICCNRAIGPQILPDPGAAR